MPPKQTILRSRPHVDIVALLQNHAIFGKLCVDHLNRLCALSTIRRVAAGSTISARNDAGTTLFGVCAGTVKIAIPPFNGQNATVKLVHAGEVFGDFALLDGQPQPTDAVAMTDCELTVIKRSDFQRFVQGEPKVALKLIEVLCTELRDVVLLTVPTRLARALLRLAGQEASSDDGKIKLTQIELAKLIRATRETVNKHLQAFAKRKWIRVERGGITVVAPAALTVIARGSVDNTKRSRSKLIHRLRRST